MGGVDTYSVGITTAPLLGGFEGMLLQENLKFRALRMQFSCILRALQATQTYKQHLSR